MPEITSFQPSRSATDMADRPAREPNGRAGEEDATPFGLLVSAQARPPQARAMQKNTPAPLARPDQPDRPEREPVEANGKAGAGKPRDDERLSMADDATGADEHPAGRKPVRPDDAAASDAETAGVTGSVEGDPAASLEAAVELATEVPVTETIEPDSALTAAMPDSTEAPVTTLVPATAVPATAPAVTPGQAAAAQAADPEAQAVITALGAIGQQASGQGTGVGANAVADAETQSGPATAEAFAAIAAKNPENPAPVKSAALEAQARNHATAEAPKAAVFAEWINDFAQGQGLIHRSGDLVGSLDRALSALPTPHAGQDALRPTPLQMLPIEIGMQAMRGVTKFQIRLDPAELGRVDVRLEFKQDGEVKANLVVDRVETLAMLKRDAHTLQQAFEQAGLRQSPDGMTFSLRNESQQNREGQRQDDLGAGRRGWNAEDEAKMGDMPPELAMRRIMIPNSTVDLMV